MQACQTGFSRDMADENHSKEWVSKGFSAQVSGGVKTPWPLVCFLCDSRRCYTNVLPWDQRGGGGESGYMHMQGNRREIFKSKVH